MIKLIKEKFGNVTLPRLCELLGLDYEEMSSIILNNNNPYKSNGDFKPSYVRLCQVMKVDPYEIMCPLQKIRYKHRLRSAIENKQLEDDTINYKYDRLSRELARQNLRYDV